MKIWLIGKLVKFLLGIAVIFLLSSLGAFICNKITYNERFKIISKDTLLAGTVCLALALIIKALF